MAVPKVSPVAEPNVSIVRFADDVVLVGGSIFAHVHIPIDVNISIYMRTTIYMGATVMAAPMMPTSLTTAAVVISAMAAAVVFRVRRRNDPNSERRSDRKDETNLLQHFLFSSRAMKSCRRTLAKGS
jgi:hypothetical protein